MAIMIVVALSCLCPMAAQEVPDSVSSQNKNLTVSLITCYPGEEIYELCGHSAIRIRGEGIDSVWNYGIFDFSQPNFVYRFVKGETDYKGDAYPFEFFLPEYIYAGRKVVEQDLNLTPEEAEKLHQLLNISVLPENAVYRYNYIKDNCSTRILNQIDSAAGSAIIYPDSIRYGTFRNEMRAYHKNYPWYQFGIDVALGSGLDKKTDSREEMFSPMDMMRNVAAARFSDGRPLVKATRTLYQGRSDVVLPPTPWWLSPLFWSWLVTLVIACVITRNIMTRRLFYPLYSVWFLLLGLAGCLVAFLVFISVHESTSPNVLILWLNPCQLLFAISAGWSRLRILSLTMAYYNIFVVGLLLLFTPWLTQSFNAAFFPLMISTVSLAACYAIIDNKSSYKKR